MRCSYQVYINVFSWFYPESLWKMIIINAPWVFTGIFGIIKPWLHPITAAKISVYGSNYKEKLEKIGVTVSSCLQSTG